MKNNMLKFMAIGLIGLSVAACTKTTPPSNPQMTGHMTNTETSGQKLIAGDSSNFDSTITVINLDVRKIVFKYANDKNEEIEKDSVIVSEVPFQLNLLAFTKDSLRKFIDAQIPAGRLHEIRLLLGPDNYVIKDSVKYALKVPSGKSSGVKIKVKGLLKLGEHNDFTIDFKIRESLKKDSSYFILRPVIKVKINKGSIEGEDSDGSDN